MKKRLLLSASFLILGTFAFGQSYLEGYVTPGLGYRHLTLNESSSTDIKDSLGKLDRVRQNWSGGISYIHGFNRDIKLQIGVMYKRANFQRVREDLQFHDTVHPSIGRIEDLSQTVQKDAFFYHQFHTISLPVLIHAFIGPKLTRSKFSIFFVGGLAPSLIVQDDIRLFLKGYSVKGESTHMLPPDYTSNQFNVDLILGGKALFKSAERTVFTLQPHFNYSLLPTASDNQVSLRTYQINLQFGVSYEL